MLALCFFVVWVPVENISQVAINMAAETRCRCLKKHDGKNGADHQAQIRDELYRNDRLDVEQMAISVAQLSGFLREELERLCVESRAKHKAAWAAAVRCGAIDCTESRV